MIEQMTPPKYASGVALERRARRVILPPPIPLTHLEFARTLQIPDGIFRGKRYDPNGDPVHACLAQEIPRGWQRIIGVGAVQTGKSLALILVPVLRALTTLRHPVVYSQPSLDKLHEAWAGKLMPSIRDSGKAGWLPEKGQGSKGAQTPKFIVFRDPATGARAGTMYLMPGGGHREGAQAAVTAAVVAVDEVDSFIDRHRVELISKRADSYGPRALRIYTSTVKKDGTTPGDTSVILALYNESTASRLHFSCPHCNHWQALEWEQVSYEAEHEPGAIATARYACAGCAVMWTEDDRQRALRSWRLVHRGQQIDQPTGTVVGEGPQTVAFGLLWTVLDSSLRSLGQAAAEHFRADRALALGDHGPMRSFWRDQLCRGYLGDRATDENGSTIIPTRNRLAALSSACATYSLRVDRRDPDGDSVHFAEIPAWVEHQTLAVDVQQGGERAPGRLYWQTLGRGGGRGCITGWGSLISAPIGRHPTTEELHASLDRLRSLIIDWAPVAPIVAKGVDVGDRQDELMGWLRSHRDWVPLKGTGPLKILDQRLDLPGWIYQREQDGWNLLLIENESVLRIVHGELLAPYGKAGCLELPKGLERTSALVMHLCSSVEYEPGKWSTKPKDRVFHPEWQTRNDYADCTVYNRALCYRWEAKASRPPPTRRYGVIGKT